MHLVLKTWVKADRSGITNHLVCPFSETHEKIVWLDISMQE